MNRGITSDVVNRGASTLTRLISILEEDRATPSAPSLASRSESRYSRRLRHIPHALARLKKREKKRRSRPREPTLPPTRSGIPWDNFSRAFPCSFCVNINTVYEHPYAAFAGLRRCVARQPIYMVHIVCALVLTTARLEQTKRNLPACT